MIITQDGAAARGRSCAALGAAVALPLLDAMVPALSAMAQTAASPVRRLGLRLHPDGDEPGAVDAERRRADHRALAVAGLADAVSRSPDASSRNLEVRNSRSPAATTRRPDRAFLSCARAKRTEGSDYELGDDGRSDRRAGRSGATRRFRRWSSARI